MFRWFVVVEFTKPDCWILLASRLNDQQAPDIVRVWLWKESMCQEKTIAGLGWALSCAEQLLLVLLGLKQSKTYIYIYILILCFHQRSPSGLHHALSCCLNVGCPVCVVLRMSLHLSPGLAVGAGKPQSTHKLAPVPSSCRFLARVPAFVYGYSEPKHIVK